jgi:hypothetical protein
MIKRDALTTALARELEQLRDLAKLRRFEALRLFIDRRGLRIGGRKAGTGGAAIGPQPASDAIR